MDIRAFRYKLTTTHIDASGNDLRYKETRITRGFPSGNFFP